MVAAIGVCRVGQSARRVDRGLGVLGAWLAGDGRRPLDAAGLLGACVIATLANPYGWDLWGFLWRTVRVARPNIEEWMPLWSFGPPQWLGPLLVAVAIGWVVARPFPGRRACLVALAVLALAGLRVARVAPMLGVAAAILLSPRFAALWPRRAFALRTAAERWTVFFAAFALAAAAAVVARLSLSCIPVDRALRPDPAAVALLKNVPPGRLVTFFNWGDTRSALRSESAGIDGRPSRNRLQRRADRRARSNPQGLSGRFPGTR